MTDLKNRRKELYQEFLWKWIERNSLSRDESLKKFVDAFSCFICSSDPAYNYNFPYLPDQFKKFISFEIGAKEKVERLRMVFNELKKSDTIMRCAIDNNLQVSINDFLELDLSGEIRLCKNFSLKGAEDKSNILTIRYKKSSREYLCTCELDERDKLRLFFEKLFQLDQDGEDIQDDG